MKDSPQNDASTNDRPYDVDRLRVLKEELGDDSTIDDLKRELKGYQAIADNPRACVSMVKRATKFIPKLLEYIALLEKEQVFNATQGCNTPFSVGIAVMASKPHAPDNPEYKEAFLLEKKKIGVMGYFYSAEAFVEKYPEVNPVTNVVIFCGGIRYNSVAEFMTWYDTLNRE